MATPTGVVAFEADGKPHALQFTTNRICLLEDRTGKSPVDITAELELNPTFSLVRTMLWCGIGQGDLTMEGAGELIDAIGKAPAVQLVKDAWRAAFPAPEEADGGKDSTDRPRFAAAG